MRRKKPDATPSRYEIQLRLQRELPRIRETIDMMVGNIEEIRRDGVSEHVAVAGGVQVLLSEWPREELCYLAAVAVSMLPRIELEVEVEVEGA